MVRTLNAQASLIEDLLCEGYDFVVPRRLQSDPLEKRFSRYRQMSDGRFLVSLREVLTSERILAINSLLKEKVNFWEEDLSLNKDPVFDEFTLELQSISAEIQEASLCAESVEVSSTIAGYIAKKLESRSNCKKCKDLLLLGDKNMVINT